LIWITLPLWILTVRVLISTLKLPDSSRFIIVITLIMVIVVSAFMLLALRSIVRLEGQPDQQLNYLIALVGGGVLLLAIILLISLGWTKAVALPGLMIGLTIVICAGLISVSVKSTGLNSGNSFEWWYPDQIYPSPKWMTISIDRIIDWNASGGIPVDIAVVDLDSPSMRWVLRNYQPHQFLPYLPPQAQTSLLITDSTFTPEIADSYRGQDLVWSRQVQWSSLSPFQYLNWMVTGQVPTSENWIILWVRTDLMPDAQFSR
jgi:hypothetical protein